MLQSFKTTIVAIIVAALNLYANGVAPKQVLLSIAVGILGAVSKDYNVTGGNTPNSKANLL
jgi:hypothetical protein